MIINKVPSHPLSFKTVHLMPDGDIDLRNIEKMLADSSLIIINDPIHIVGNVLGLLLLKRVIFINGYVGWSHIVKDYLSSKDLLSCQEELIDAGYLDHAQL